MKMSRKLPLKRSKWANTAKNIAFQDGEKKIFIKSNMYELVHTYMVTYTTSTMYGI